MFVFCFDFPFFYSVLLYLLLFSYFIYLFICFYWFFISACTFLTDGRICPHLKSERAETFGMASHESRWHGRVGTNNVQIKKTVISQVLYSAGLWATSAAGMQGEGLDKGQPAQSMPSFSAHSVTSVWPKYMLHLQCDCHRDVEPFSGHGDSIQKCGVGLMPIRTVIWRGGAPNFHSCCFPDLKQPWVSLFASGVASVFSIRIFKGCCSMVEFTII